MNDKQEENNKSAGRIISELSRAAHIYFQSEFKQYSIGHAQIRALLYISKNEGVSQLELSKYLHLDKSSITSQLQILERNGYIIRLISQDDARKHQIRITDKTKEILEPLCDVFSSWTDGLYAGFSEKEKEEAYAYLKRMRDNAVNKLHEAKSCDE